MNKHIFGLHQSGQSRLSRQAWSALLAVWVGVVCSPGQAQERRYEAGSAKAVEIGTDLREALDDKVRGGFRAQPLRVVEEARPLLHLVEEGGTAGVVLSTGFLELMNRAAHAKAIDEVEKGYLQHYLESWVGAAESGAPPALPNISQPGYWSEEVMDRQQTHFAQFVGLAVGIEFANYYLGHFRKYAGRLEGVADPGLALNRLLDAKEWEAAFASGARNSVACAYGVDGASALLQCVEPMPKRPDWILHFAPEARLLKAGKLRSKLQGIERAFFK